MAARSPRTELERSSLPRGWQKIHCTAAARSPPADEQEPEMDAMRGVTYSFDVPWSAASGGVGRPSLGMERVHASNLHSMNIMLCDVSNGFIVTYQ